MTSNPERYLNSFVRVKGKSIGAGCWVQGKENKTYILTCAHVSGEEGKEVEVQFHIGDGKFGCPTIGKNFKSIRVEEGDLALIVVDGILIPKNAFPIKLLDVSFADNVPTIVYGFPKAFPGNGRSAHLLLKPGLPISSDQGVPRIQLHEAQYVREGFSGSSLIHSDMGFILGIINEIESEDLLGSPPIPYAIPSHFIAEKFSEFLECQTIHPYHNWLKSLYEKEVIFNDEKGMTLSAIYVEPNCSIHVSCLLESHQLHVNKPFVDDEVTKAKRDFYHLDVDANEFVNTIFRREEKTPLYLRNDDPKFIMLRGYPGQGKSTYIKRIIYDYLSQRPPYNVYYIRLRYISNTRSLLNDPFTIIKSEIMENF
jgi:hypothetical protein